MASNYDDFDNLFGNDAEAVLHELTSWSDSDHEEKMAPEMSLEEPPPEMSLEEPPSKCTRFAFPKSSPEREKAACGVIPHNTKSSTQWALKNFNTWVENRAALCSSFVVPADLLRCHDPMVVCKYLCLYVMETRCEDGKPYPPSTIRVLVSGLNRILQANKAPFSVLDRSNHDFHPLLNTLDTVSSDLHREGVGVTKYSAQVILPEHEELFWVKGLLGYSSPKVLQHTVFFYMGLNFTLRGVQEQYDLVPDQLKRVPPDVGIYNSSVYYLYTEFISKNNQHRFKDINSTNKEVCLYAQPGSNRCLVKLLDMYFKYLPPQSIVFYLRPLSSFADGTSLKKCSFSKQRVGVNTLKQIVPDICKKSGCGAKYSNHSLRVTAITRMFNSGVSEKKIAETSGHKSVKGLREYEHTSCEQQKQITSIVNNRGMPAITEGKVISTSTPTIDEGKAVNVSSNVATTNSTTGFTGSFSNCTFHITK